MSLLAVTVSGVSPLVTNLGILVLAGLIAAVVVRRPRCAAAQ